MFEAWLWPRNPECWDFEGLEAWRWDFERSWQDNLLPVELVLDREESGRVGLRSRGRLQLQDLLEGSCSLTHVDVLLEWRGAGVVRQLATDAGLLASQLRVRLQTMQEQPVGERRRQEQGAHVVGWLERERSGAVRSGHRRDDDRGQSGHEFPCGGVLATGALDREVLVAGRKRDGWFPPFQRDSTTSWLRMPVDDSAVFTLGCVFIFRYLFLP